MGNIRQQKIGFFGQLQPTGVDPTVGNRLKALAGIAEDVGEVALGRVQQEAVKRGQLKGAKVQRDEEGNIIPPELESDFTIFGQNFNKAAILANRAQIQIDSKERLDALQEEHKLDPEAFKNATEAFKQGTLRGMPEELANIIALDIDSSVASRTGVLNKAFFKREDAKQKATIAEGIETATDDILNSVRTGDEERSTRLIIEQNAALDAAVDAGMINPIAAENIKETVRERISQQNTLRQVDEIIFNEDLSLQERVDKGVDFLGSLRDSELKDLSPEQKDALVNVVGAKINGLQTQLAQELSQKTIEQTRQVSNLKVNAKLGFSNPEDLMEETELLFNTGLISGNERTSIMTDILKGQKGKVNIARDDALVSKKLMGANEVVLDQKVVDDYYDRNVLDQIKDLPPGVKIAEQALFVDRLKMVPKRIKQELSNNILSGDPELILQAGDLVNRLDEIPGLVDLVVNASQRAFINDVTDFSLSMSPEEAVKLAKELTDPRDKARIEAKEEEIKTEKMREDYPDVVENAFEGFFGGDFLVDNVNKESVNREFETLFESFFKAGMDKDRAEEKAIDLLKTNWKESQFGFMKHPPETFYSVGGEVDYIKDQLNAELVKGTIGLEFKKENIFLLSDETTGRTASQGQPNYRVMVIDNNGEIHMPVLSDEDGKPTNRWMPDMQSEADRQTKENEELFSKERKFKTRKDIIPDLGSIN